MSSSPIIAELSTWRAETFWSSSPACSPQRRPRRWPARPRSPSPPTSPTPAKEIAAAFKQKTGHEAVLSFGASGNSIPQISQGAPFQVFLSADDDRPKAAVDAGLAVADSRFTYAIGKLVLWSKSLDLTKGDETLKANAFAKLSIANPKSAPLRRGGGRGDESLGVYDAMQPKIVQGASIAQAFQFVDTGNAELGFVALSQIAGIDTRVALAGAANALRADPAGRGAAEEPAPTTKRPRRFSPSSRARRRARSSRNTATASNKSEAPRLPSRPAGNRVELTIELAAVTTIAARHHRHAARLVAGALAAPGGRRRSRPSSRCRSCCRRRCSASICWSRSARTGPAARSRGLWGARTLAFTFSGLVVGSVLYSLPFVVQPIRNAFAAIGDRPLEVAATLARLAARARS